ncbi:MAG: hypothetical protein AAFN13_13400 [Bacteroidota bacterium]
MGQQQLLLLVLCVVIIALSVVSGIQTYQDSRRRIIQEQAIVRLRVFADNIQAWKRKHAALGGGDNGDPHDLRDFSLSSIGLTPDGITGGRYAGREYIIEPSGACIAFRVGANRGGDVFRRDPIDITWHPDGDCGTCDNPNWYHPFWLRVYGPDPQDDIRFVFNLNRDYTTPSGNW